MHKSKSLSVIIFLLLSALAFAATDSLNVAVVSDSLRQSIEQRVEEEFGINESTSLSETAKVLNIELSDLKKQLGLDNNNNKLDKMKLKQLGISTYSVLLAQESIKYGFNENNTIAQIAARFSIPTKKLKNLLNLDSNDSSLNNRSLLSLDIPLEKVVTAKIEFKDSLVKTGTNIVFVGMIVVFCALLVTSIIIGLLKHLNIKQKSKTESKDIRISGKTVTANKDITNDELIAVITALHIYANNLEERRKLTMKFHRGNINYWHIAGLSNMPNRIYTGKRI